VVFGFELAFGVELIINARHGGVLDVLADVLIASLLIGIGRAWELVGEWDSGITSSIRRLIGHQPPAPVAVVRETSDEPVTTAEVDLARPGEQSSPPSPP
jgi:hypothetical protein